MADLAFELQVNPYSSGTEAWLVTTLADGGAVGTVKWSARWDSYVFVPEPGPERVWDGSYMAELTSFINARMAEL